MALYTIKYSKPLPCVTILSMTDFISFLYILVSHMPPGQSFVHCSIKVQFEEVNEALNSTVYDTPLVITLRSQYILTPKQLYIFFSKTQFQFLI